MSEADCFQLLPIAKRQKILSQFSDDELAALKYDWDYWARPEQQEPAGNWSDWMIMAGRGWGKTRTGAEWIRNKVESGQAGRIALIARTSADVRTVMIEGESGLLAIFPPDKKPIYQPSLRKITFHNGAIATTYSSQEPDMLRGPQHDAGWCDEPAAWVYAQDTYDNFRMGLRLGQNPQAVMTTTPRPIRLIKSLLYQITTDGDVIRGADGEPLPNPTTVISKGSSWDNVNNLPQKWFDDLKRKYEGTRLGRQELYAELLMDVPGALWNQEILDSCRYVPPFIDGRFKMPEMKLVAVGADPNTTSGKDSDEFGIIICGLGADGYGYVMDDATMTGRPAEWGMAINQAYTRHMANTVVAEVNNGGEMIEYVIHSINPRIPVKSVHASRSKQARAQPVAALYEQGRIRHIGTHAKLEDQMCTWCPGDGASPDRLDAMVWAFTHLFNLYDKKIETKPTVTARSVTQSSRYY
jgi:phage terminase large subunit-like protein